MLALVLGAAAFAPRGPVPSGKNSQISAAVNGLVGDIPPLGYFDPLGFGKDPEKLKQYRECELKHGRVAMAACLGWVRAA